MKLMHALALQLSERLEEPVFLRKVGLPSPPLPSSPATLRLFVVVDCRRLFVTS